MGRTPPLVLIAASGLAREVLSVLAERDEFVVRGVLDDSAGLQGTSISGVPILGSIDAVTGHPDAQLLICAGRGSSRRVICERLSSLGIPDGRFATVIDPTVRLPRTCQVGVGSIVLAQTVLTADVWIGRHVVCMPHVTLTHDNRVEDFATICAGVSLGGNVQIGQAAYLGMNSAVREHTSVGAEAVLAMGAVLLKDMPPAQTWMGVPARPRDPTIRAMPSLRNFETSEY